MSLGNSTRNRCNVSLKVFSDDIISDVVKIVDLRTGATSKDLVDLDNRNVNANSKILKNDIHHENYGQVNKYRKSFLDMNGCRGSTASPYSIVRT